MFRRQFLQLIPLASAAAIAPLEAIGDASTKTLTYKVKGFSCITCAVGLDTMLLKQKGIVSSKSTYPDGIARISFHPGMITESAIREFISSMGFTVAQHE